MVRAGEDSAKMCDGMAQKGGGGTNEDPERQPHLTEPVPQTASDCRAVAGQGL